MKKQVGLCVKKKTVVEHIHPSGTGMLTVVKTGDCSRLEADSQETL